MMSAIFGLLFFHSDYIRAIIPGWIHNKCCSDLHKNKEYQKCYFPYLEVLNSGWEMQPEICHSSSQILPVWNVIFFFFSNCVFVSHKGVWRRKTPGYFIHSGLWEQYVVLSEEKQQEFKMLTCPLTSKWSTASLCHTVQQLSATAYIGQARPGSSLLTNETVNRDSAGQYNHFIWNIKFLS